MKIVSIIICLFLGIICTAQTTVTPNILDTPRVKSKHLPDIKTVKKKRNEDAPGISSKQLQEIKTMNYFLDTLPKRTNIVIKENVITRYEIRTIKGRITDPVGNPVRGAYIKIKGTTKGITTDGNGNFTLGIDKYDKLNVIITGYADFELSPDQTNITINGFTVQSQQTITNGITNSTKETNLNIFPVPYPVPSALYVLNSASILNARYFSEVDAVLKAGLDKCNYDERSYYYIPHGFALVTQMEQINSGGTSLDPPDRWNSKIANDINNPWDYIKALFTTTKGYYRVLVFLFTDINLSSNNDLATESDARKWLNNGFSDLPIELKNKTFTNNYRCTLLVYHYEKLPGSEAKMLIPSDLSGRKHFINSTLANYIR
jgi:hypothetical protein